MWEKIESPATERRFLANLQILQSCLAKISTSYIREKKMEISKANNTTAMIIASQNQDYVDEGLAEYQDQIHKLQSKLQKVANPK